MVEENGSVAAVSGAATPAPQIVGGEFAAERLAAFLREWQPTVAEREMPWSIWETVDAVRFEHGAWPALGTDIDPRWLERVRIFGTGGDLSVRRDEQRILWHFIGGTAVRVAAGFGNEIFQGACGTEQPTDSALLWGEHVGAGEWKEDRVAAATLRYPLSAGGRKRVRVCFTPFTHAGQLTFVWWKNIEVV